ncbi:MAG: ribonuclease R [Bordetella sp.]|nr:MAG: ribonuclease R [Bordetella sp.]
MNEIPSRELILKILRQSQKPLSYLKLVENLNLQKESQLGFERRLSAMERDGQLSINSNGILLSNKRFISGTVEGHREGFGFLIRDDNESDLFLSHQEMLKVLHGDKVLVKINTKNRNKFSGTIIEVLNHRNIKIVGYLHLENHQKKFVPEDPRIRQDILVPSYEGEKNGQYITVEIIKYPTRYHKPFGRVYEILGESNEPGIEVKVSIRKFNIPEKFSGKTINQANLIPESVIETDLIDRIDLRHMPFITIDGDDSLDFDDAVYCEPLKSNINSQKSSNWRLIVAISDVSHYVKENSLIDYEAVIRGTSIYFPNRVVPMLPEILSNNICSLCPNVDRLVLVCDMVISSHVEEIGSIISYKFYNAVINSYARTTYKYVYKILLQNKEQSEKTNDQLFSLIDNLHKVYLLLAEARKRRGAIDFDKNEPKIIYDKFGRIENILIENRNDIERLIEECMLAANMCAAEFITSKGHSNLYRVHERPSKNRLNLLKGFLKYLNLEISGGEQPHAKNYSDFLDSVRHRSDFNIIQSACLRSMQQALYTPKNIGHFGLACANYSHFTSPIRRYSDLLTHRIIKSILINKSYVPNFERYNLQEIFPDWSRKKSIWENLGFLLSTSEKRADDASRDVIAWLKCWFVKERVKEDFCGIISGVTNFGIFVTLDNVHIEGLIHLSNLGNENFIFNDVSKKLYGIQTGYCYSLADRVKVQISQVDLSTRRIKLHLITHNKSMITK